MNTSSRRDRIRSLTAVLAAMLLVPSAHGATLAVANKAEATVSLIDLESGDVVATQQPDARRHTGGECGQDHRPRRIR